MDTVFMNYENSKTADLYRLLLNISDKINLKRNGKYFLFSNHIFHIIYFIWKM